MIAAIDSSFGQTTPIIDQHFIDVVPLTLDYLLPFEDNSLNVLISMGGLEHVPQDCDSLKELSRTPRPSGLFFCFFLPYTFLWTQQIEYKSGNAYHVRLYSVNKTKMLLQDSGFERLDLRHRQLLPKNRVRYKNYRLMEHIDLWICSHTFSRYFATNIEFVCANRKNN